MCLLYNLIFLYHNEELILIELLKYLEINVNEKGDKELLKQRILKPSTLHQYLILCVKQSHCFAQYLVTTIKQIPDCGPFKSNT